MSNKILLAATLLLAIQQPCLALDSDRAQQLEWSSTGPTLSNNRKGTIELNDDVVITQGTLKITCDKAVVYYQGSIENITQIVIEGKPASFQQQLKVNEPVVKGRANTIRYDHETKELDFIDNVTINNANGAVTTAPTLKYFLETGDYQLSEGGRTILPGKNSEDKDGDS